MRAATRKRHNSVVGRYIPWALLALLSLGVAGFAALGQAESPGVTPTAWVASVLSATNAAGSAHLRFSTTTTSADFGPSTTVGTGVVDFANGNYRVTSRYHQFEQESTNGGPPEPVVQNWMVQTIAIGQTVYRQFSFPSAFPSSPWTKANYPRDVHQAFGLDAGIGAENAVAGLALITPPARVSTLGPGEVDGLAATRYLVGSEPVYVCGPHGGTIFHEQLGPTTVWIDSKGRLLQARLSQQSVSSFAPTSRRTTGSSPSSILPVTAAPTTSTSTLRFSDFGVPVHVVAPTVNGSEARSTSISLQLKTSATPCGH